MNKDKTPETDKEKRNRHVRRYLAKNLIESDDLIAEFREMVNTDNPEWAEVLKETILGRMSLLKRNTMDALAAAHGSSYTVPQP